MVMFPLPMPRWKRAPSESMPKPMMAKPAYMIGLRPSRSTKAMAMKVARTLIVPMSTVPHICSAVVLNPASLRMRGA